MKQYPKWLYKKGESPIIVKDEAEHNALDSGWVDSPAKFNNDDLAPEKATESPEAEDAPKKPKAKGKK